MNHCQGCYPACALRRIPVYRWGGKIYGQSNSITSPLILDGILKKAGHDVSVYEELNADELILMKEGRIIKAGISPGDITSSLLNEIYGMDVAAEMKKRGSFWQETK